MPTPATTENTSTDEWRKIQSDIRRRSHDKIRVEAARREVPFGVVISDLADKYLPDLPTDGTQE